MISTPPRVGNPHLQPKLLFPDSPLSSPIPVADNSPASRRVVQNCDAGVQTVPTQEVPASISVAVQTDTTFVTLQHFEDEMQVLRNELRALVIGFGF